MTAGSSTACLYPELLEEALAELVNNGIKTTEIFVNTHCEVAPEFTEILGSILSQSGAECIAYHPYTCPIEPMMFFSGYSRRVKDMLDYHKYYFEAMNRLGARIFVLHGNMNVVAVDEDFYFEIFSELAAAAAPYGITVAQENVARCQSHSLDFLRNMSETLGDSAKFVLDIKQAVRSQEDPFEIVRTLGNKIIHVHMSDNDSASDCLAPGSGSFDIYGLLKELYLRGFDGAVITELYRKNFGSVSDLVESCRYIENIINRIESEIIRP
ncbi:sugar phosphate isomerase/epimerase [Ruminococcus sp. HUN007]|uniref:sugar phosphate isomerase/epimerase family protein n=1 Tax=Ruminococcus sp. HUN007 TaxID=1514668 RepID=UPI0005D21842|nr:sugar phosphate isomerase/epimerase [Ruminococcus sp. HUN007]